MTINFLGDDNFTRKQENSVLVHNKTNLTTLLRCVADAGAHGCQLSLKQAVKRRVFCSLLLRQLRGITGDREILGWDIEGCPFSLDQFYFSIKILSKSVQFSG